MRRKKRRLRRTRRSSLGCVRVQCIDQLQIINEFGPEKIKVDESVKAETARMWEVSCNKNPTAWTRTPPPGCLAVDDATTFCTMEKPKDLQRWFVVFQYPF